jgi:hypothetical protein
MADAAKEAAIWSVTGRVWDADTRGHTKLQTIDFERRIDADGFMSFNRNWIAGMVLDRNEAARIADGCATPNRTQTQHKEQHMTIRDTLSEDDKRTYDTLRALGGYRDANAFAQAVTRAAHDKAYRARKLRGHWVVWCDASDHVVEF